MDEKKHWPESPTARGVTYAVNDPIFAGDRLVVMSFDTWVDFGTVHEAQRRKVEQQDKTLLALQTANAALVAQLKDTTTRLDNLRASEKKRRFGMLNLFTTKEPKE